MRKVRTTMQPNVELEVSDAEYTDLSRAGLIAQEDSAAPADADEKPAQKRGKAQEK